MGMTVLWGCIIWLWAGVSWCFVNLCFWYKSDFENMVSNILMLITFHTKTDTQKFRYHYLIFLDIQKNRNFNASNSSRLFIFWMIVHDDDDDDDDCDDWKKVRVGEYNNSVHHREQGRRRSRCKSLDQLSNESCNENSCFCGSLWYDNVLV